MMPNMTANRPLTIACGIEANSPPNLPAGPCEQASMSCDYRSRITAIRHRFDTTTKRQQPHR